MFLLRDGEKLGIPAPPDGAEVVARLALKVPGRTEGRTSLHREQYCIAAFLAALLREAPSLFPCTITKGEAPDYIIWSDGAQHGLAVEHTEMGSPAHQAALTRFERGSAAVELFSQDGYRGDAPERMFAGDLAAALARKTSDKFWRHAPATHERWLAIYDNSETGFFLARSFKDGALRAALDAGTGNPRLHGASIVTDGSGATLLRARPDQR